MLTRYLVLLILIIPFVACNKADDNKRGEAGELVLEKLEEITLEVQEPIFGRFLEIFRVSKDGKYFLFNDLSQQKAYVFTSNGGFVNRIGESGKGPKGIVGLYGFDFTEENEVFIYDSSQRMFKIFDMDGALINAVSIDEDSGVSIPPFHLRYHKGKIYAPIIEPVHINEPHNSKLLVEISIDGAVDTLFGKHDEFAAQDNHYIFTNVLTIDESRDKIYTSLSTSPFIQEFDIVTHSLTDYFGEKTQSHKIPDNEITRFISINEVSKRATGTTSNYSIHTTDEFIILHRQLMTEKWFATASVDAKENTLLIFDKDNHDFIKEINTEHILGATRNNKLYFIENLNPDNYTLGVYEISSSNE